jgi:hypothetical protein
MFSIIIKIKNLQHEGCVEQWGELLAKGNFKRWLVCDEFDKIWSNQFQTKLKLTPNETRNGLSEWIHLVEVHIFHVGHMFQ